MSTQRLKCLREILHAQLDMVSIAAPDGRIDYLNESGRRLLGIDPEADLAEVEIPRLHPDWAADLIMQQAIPQAITLGCWKGRTAVLDNRGREIPVFQTILAHRDETGELYALSTTIRDISDTLARRRADEDIRRQDRLLNQQAELLELAHDAIIIQDLAGRATFWNRGAERTLGWSRDEVIGRNVHRLLMTRLPMPFEDIKRRLLSQESWEGEFSQAARDGRPVHMHSRWALMRDEQGRPQAILEIDRDITERRKTEARVEAERQRLFSLLNMLPGFVALKDREHRIRYASRGFLETFSEPAGRTCHKVQFDLDAPCETCPLNEVLETRRPMDWESKLPDGRTFHIWAFPFTDSDGAELLLELGVDVTPTKEMELLISQASESERRVIGRDLHEALGQTLSGLGFMIGSLAEKMSVRMPDQRHTAEMIVETIGEAVSHARTLAHGLDPVGLQDDGLASALCELAKKQRKDGGIDCRFHCDGDIMIDEFAATHLYRIAQEAATNAARHARARHIDIKLADADGMITLIVHDDGDGLPQRDAATNCTGLRVMRHRAAAIGASLKICSEPGRGVTIACKLPSALSEGNRA